MSGINTPISPIHRARKIRDEVPAHRAAGHLEILFRRQPDPFPSASGTLLQNRAAQALVA